MKDNYDATLKEVLEQEGGYSNDAGDSGGPTKYGITIIDARLYWKHNATAADVRAMPLNVAKDIYKSKYWDALQCDSLPDGLDLAIMDYGVNSGIHRAAMVLQRFVGVSDDGVIGPRTLAAVETFSDKTLIEKVCDERLSFLQSLHTWRLFGRGWGRRVAEVKTLSLKMASSIPVEAKSGEA